ANLTLFPKFMHRTFGLSRFRHYFGVFFGVSGFFLGRFGSFWVTLEQVVSLMFQQPKRYGII
ncbi:hypothetical protein, partial [Paramuribaculum intestinale]|uniref:hypothetical protein n=1 Tax=Paramuribaculum intestinale TaxID=2094151 RepID=UPI00272FFDB2